MLTVYTPTKVILNGNVDGEEKIELLAASYKEWLNECYNKKKKENTVEKKYMKDILEKEICQQILTIENPDFVRKEQQPDYDREVGSVTNDNIVFYICGNLLHRRRNSCKDCFATMSGSKSLPANLDVQKLTICKDQGALQYVSLNMFSLLSAAEAAVLRVVAAKQIFLRDCYEDVLHDICLDPLAPLGCPKHRVSLMTDLIFDYVLSRFRCIAMRQKMMLTENIASKSSCSRKLAKLYT